MFKYYIVLSILATFGAVYNSYVSHTQFYPTILYLTTNKINRTILFNFALMMVSRFLIFLIQLTFGEIRELEKTSVIEKTKRKIIEIAYLFYFMNDGLDWQFLYLMMGLIALSVLHWIAVKRAQYLIAESTIRFAPHLKLIMCFIVLFYIDIKTSLYFLSADVYEFQDVLFGFEFLLLPIKLTLPFIKYTVNIFEILTYSQFGWKQTIFSFLDVIFSLIKVSIQICLIRYAFQTQGFILYLLVDAFENIFGLFRQIKVFFNQIRLVRLIDKIQDVDTIDKNHNTCLICLNDLDQGKRLSCGHIFHKSCIKTWIQENPNQFCPKCKKPIQFDETQPFVDKDQLKQQSQIYFSELLEIQNTISVLQLVHKIRDMQGIPQNQDGIGSVQFGLPTEAIYNPSIENEIRRLQINQMNAVLLGFEHGKIEPSQFQL